jgi:GH25 family lysozyme M1 (1,4-beta-N-acetylmuramidase)
MLSRGRPSVVAAASAPIQGVDVSSSQHSGDGGINWGQVAGAGYQFALVKVTEGNYYVNPYFDSDYRGAKSAKLYAGAYHFAIPSASDGTSQADYFLDSAAYKADGATLPPALDIEWNPYDSSQPCYGLDGDSLVSWVAAFRAEVERRTGRPPAIYTAASTTSLRRGCRDVRIGPMLAREVCAQLGASCLPAQPDRSACR